MVAKTYLFPARPLFFPYFPQYFPNVPKQLILFHQKSELYLFSQILEIPLFVRLAKDFQLFHVKVLFHQDCKKIFSVLFQKDQINLRFQKTLYFLTSCLIFLQFPNLQFQNTSVLESVREHR